MGSNSWKNQDESFVVLQMSVETPDLLIFFVVVFGSEKVMMIFRCKMQMPFVTRIRKIL